MKEENRKRFEKMTFSLNDIEVIFEYLTLACNDIAIARLFDAIDLIKKSSLIDDKAVRIDVAKVRYYIKLYNGRFNKKANKYIGVFADIFQALDDNTKHYADIFRFSAKAAMDKIRIEHSDVKSEFVTANVLVDLSVDSYDKMLKEFGKWIDLRNYRWMRITDIQKAVRRLAASLSTAKDDIDLNKDKNCVQASEKLEESLHDLVDLIDIIKEYEKNIELPA